MKDLIDLVKLGLKPSDIKEMVELEKQVKDINIEQAENNTEEHEEPPTSEQHEEEKEDKPNDDANINNELTSAKAEIEELKKQITSMQNENKNKDMSGNQNNKTIDEQIIDMFTNFM